MIDDLTFAVRRGSRTALIGPNGAGKTTVFNLITGVYRGRPRLASISTAPTSPMCPRGRRVDHGVARSFQNVRLMPHLNALENVMVGQHSRNRGFVGVLQPVNLDPQQPLAGGGARRACSEAGLGEYERAAVGSLPYGVQKRIELVRALMAHPRLLLLDEPAAGLNPAETDALQRHLRKICAQGDVTLAGGRARHAFRRRAVRACRRASASAARSPRARRRTIRQDRACAGNLSRARQPPRPPSRRRRAVLLEVRDLHVRYGRVHAVRGVSIELAPGEIVAVLGANGAGKSSMLRALLGIEKIARWQRAFRRP